MIFDKCIPCGLLALSIVSMLLSGCTDTTVDDSFTTDDSITVSTTTTTTSLMTPFATVTNDLNGTRVVFDAITQTFFVALGTEGHASCENGLNCTLWRPQSFGLSSVDDVAVADGLVFLLDGNFGNRESSGHLAVAFVNGTVAQQAVQVNSRSFNGVSAANGRVVVSGGVDVELQLFLYSDNGTLALNNNASFRVNSFGQSDVHLPSGNHSLAFVSTGVLDGGIGFGVTIASLPSLAPLNSVLLTNPINPTINFPLRSTSFLRKDGSLCLVAIAPRGGLGFSRGFTVVCHPEDASRQQQRFTLPLSGAQSVAVGGDRAYVLTFLSALTLVTIDLAPLETDSQPKILCENLVRREAGLREPFSVATNANGSQVLISANSQGLLLNQDFTCSSNP